MTYNADNQLLTAADGLTVTDHFEYAAYGERTYRTGSTDTPFQFNGCFGVQTDTSGLLYMRARCYNVETRRFQSADPMGFAESSNFYWFANADPVSLVDPFGLGASDGGGFWSGVGRVLGLVARESIGVPRGILDYFFENGVPPSGGLAHYTGAHMNGIHGNEKEFRRDTEQLNLAGYYNPSSGFLADVTQTILSMLLLGFGDSLGNGFSSFLHQLPSSALSNISVHSQATAHTSMQALHGNLPAWSNLSLNSPAINQGIAFIADAFYSGNMHYNQPEFDIANVYTFPLNPLRLLSLLNPPAGADVHSANAFTRPQQIP